MPTRPRPAPRRITVFLAVASAVLAAVGVGALATGIAPAQATLPLAVGDQGPPRLPPEVPAPVAAPTPASTEAPTTVAPAAPVSPVPPSTAPIVLAAPKAATVVTARKAATTPSTTAKPKPSAASTVRSVPHPPPETPKTSPDRTPVVGVGATSYTPPPLPPAPPAAPCNRACARRPGPPRALVIGDSITMQTEQVTKGALEERGIQTVTRSAPGTGLLQGLNPKDLVPASWNWMDEIRKSVGDIDPDIVVAEFIGAYFPPADGSGFAYGSEAFRVAWQRAAEEVMQIVTARHATIYWVIAPPMGSDPWREGADLVNTIYYDIAARWTGGPLQDPAQLIDEHNNFTGPDGKFSLMLPGPDGEPVQFRWGDGIHFMPIGQDRYVERLLTVLEGYDTTRFTVRPPS